MFSLLLAIVLQEPVTASIRVEAGDHDRLHTPITVPCPAEAAADLPDHPYLHGSNGPIPLQVSTDGEPASLQFVLPSLGAGQSVDFAVKAGEASPASFAWRPQQPGGTTDLLHGELPVLRYVHPTYDRDDVENTKKPFHHVFAVDGTTLLTKGPGGLYSHHRGIFFGYNQCRVGGKSHDIWHANDGERSQHVQTLAQWQGAAVGGHRVRIDWCDPEGEPFATEQRSLSVWHQADGSRLIELTTRLETTGETVLLRGDRQHAGVQFRASQAVAAAAEETLYLRPTGWDELGPEQEINDAAHLDLPWNALRFSLEGEDYTVAYLSDPANPGLAEFSERRYGRFGEFFPWDLREDHPLEARYRWWITTAEVARGDVEARYKDLAEPPSARLIEAPR